ncbi:MAG: IS21 family transposase [Proteobacteria bacterium]|nr:IS21 family transposase [Pseudomonadota bacterium]
MRKIKEVLRLHYERDLSPRQIAKSLVIGRSTVQDYLRRAKQAGLSWPLPPELDEATLEHRLFPSTHCVPQEKRQMPSLEYLHQELKKKGVTLQLLWYEYKEKHPDGYQYSQFCRIYRQWAEKLEPCLRQEYRAGQKLFVDYAGQTMEITDPETGEMHQAQIFVATLGASNYTFAEATLCQDLRSWIRSHVHAFEFFHGVTEILTPDNLKDAVTRSCRYEPDLNATYRDLAEHYGAVIIPARVGKARDKAKVESGVLQVERWVLAPLRHRTFFSLRDLNEAIAVQLEILNGRPFEKLEATRRSLFETLDKPALKPLPAHRFTYAEWMRAKVNIDYHIEVDHHYYSVPYQLIHERVDVRLTDTTVEIFFKSRRVALHCRSYRRGRHTTLATHMPKSHQKYLEWTPSRLIRWAGQIGPHTQNLVACILENRPHPEQGYRSCLGLLRLGKRYCPERLEAACARALAFKAYSYRNVESILKKGLDQQPLNPSSPQTRLPLVEHENLRGREYYQ